MRQPSRRAFPGGHQRLAEQVGATAGPLPAGLAARRPDGGGRAADCAANLAVALSFNGIGVPLAVTGLLAPVWAMIAMIASVSVVLANSFGTRIRPRSFLIAGRWLGRASRKLIRLISP